MTDYRDIKCFASLFIAYLFVCVFVTGVSVGAARLVELL